MAPSNSPSLLSIPREIRDLIYKELLCIPIITPPSPSDPGLRFHEPFKGDYYFKLSSERFPTHSHLNLLLCNHQLHTEFLEFLDTTHSVWEYAKLDCMTEGLDMWPTWTICPADRSPKIRNLDIDLRVWNMGPLYARLLPPSISWYAFSRLLHRLLKYGPTLRFTGHGANMISVDTISIQILPQAPDEEHSEYDEDSELEKIGNKFEKFIQLQLLEDFSGEVARLKLKYGDKVCEFVAGKRESVIETSG